MAIANRAGRGKSSAYVMNLRVLIVTGRNERATFIEQALRSAHHEAVTRIAPDEDLIAHVQQTRPDALVFDVETLTLEVVRRLERLLQHAPLPVTVFADRSDREPIQAAVRAGVGAIVVDGFSPSRVLPVLVAGCTRFREFQALRRERDTAVRQLRERKIVERAKGMLMRRRRLAEDEAYALLRKMAMDKNKRLGEVAESILLAEEALANGQEASER